MRNNSIKAGAVAGNLSSDGRPTIRIGNVVYYAHRIAWLLYYGVEPPNEVDHINRVKSDNRISNLRAATRSQNNRNCATRRGNKSGIKGVKYYPERAKPWRVTIRIDNKIDLPLGYYATKVEAAAAYLEAAKKYHGEFACADYRITSNGRLRVLLT